MSPEVSSNQALEVDSWRSKRRRRNSSVSATVDSLASAKLTWPQLAPDSIEVDDFPYSALQSNASVMSSPIPTPAFAATAAEFHLFPQKEINNNRLRRPSYNPIESSFDVSPTSTSRVDLERLRSHAFWELHKSVAENGEGLVRRMRSYERSRSKGDTYLKAKEAYIRGRKRDSLIIPARETIADDSDEDDIQIFAGNGLDENSFPDSPRHRTRAMSFDMMDDQRIDARSQSLPGGARTPSPEPSNSSIYISDEDDLPLRTALPASSPHPYDHSFTPALSHTTSESASSSLLSLPMLPISDMYHMSSGSSPPNHDLPPPLTLPASRSEKAIAALSLAMANGAGSLNDYEGLLQHTQTSHLDDSEVGAMWN